MSDDDCEFFAGPIMKLVPGFVTVPDGAIDTLGDEQGVVIGADHMPGFGPCLFIGTRMKDGTAQIAAIPPHFWVQLTETVERTFDAIERGDFNSPTVQQ